MTTTTTDGLTTVVLKLTDFELRALQDSIGYGVQYSPGIAGELETFIQLEAKIIDAIDFPEKGEAA